MNLATFDEPGLECGQPRYELDEPKLKNENDRVNYSLGCQVGGDFKRQGVEIRPELVVKGMQDALSEAEPSLSTEEMTKTLVALKKRIVTAQRAELKQAAEVHPAESKAFLE